jgi:hypothetical protein
MPERAWLLALLLAGCSAAVEDGTASGNPLLVHDTRNPKRLNAQGVFIPDPAALVERERLPELAFREFSAGLPPSGTWSGRPLLCDFSGDGRADLVASNCEEQGYRAWQAPGPAETLWQARDEGLTPGLGCGACCAIDFDHDGRADLALSSFASGVRVFLNDGRMNWREASGLVETPPVGDLAAGKGELVGVGYPRGGLKVFLGDEHVVLGEEEFGRALTLADLDLDGRDDLVVATGQRVRAFPSWREQSAGLPAPARPDSLRGLCVGHFHGQGRPQIAVCSEPDPALPESERDSIGVFGWDEARGAWIHVDQGLPRGDTYSDLAAADFDGDGKLDLATLSLEHGAAIYLGDGAGGFRAVGRLAGAHGRGRLAVGDIDGDGRPDLVLAVPAAKDGPEGGGVRAFLNQPAIWVAR